MLRSIFSMTVFLFLFLGGLRCWLWTRCIDECTNYHIWNHQHYNYYTYHQSESSVNRGFLFHQGICYLSFGSVIYFKKGTHSDTLLKKRCKFTTNTLSLFTCLSLCWVDYHQWLDTSPKPLGYVYASTKPCCTETLDLAANITWNWKEYNHIGIIW